MKKVKVYKIEIMVIDFDGIGEKEIQNAIENTSYPNDCISPKVKSLETREVNWSDEHPLNQMTSRDAAYRNLFEKNNR